jgi:hypothetical protein
MSAETDFRALLAGYAPLTALVGQDIALNVAPAGAGLPLVVFGGVHQRTLGLNNSLQADQVTLLTQCWADNAAAADAVADAVIAAVATAPAAACAVVTDRASTFDAELGLHATELTVEWWP